MRQKSRRETGGFLCPRGRRMRRERLTIFPGKQYNTRVFLKDSRFSRAPWIGPGNMTCVNFVFSFFS
jgi:hypothetical protein